MMAGPVGARVQSPVQSPVHSPVQSRVQLLHRPENLVTVSGDHVTVSNLSDRLD